MQIILVTFYKTIEYFLTYALVSPELKGYISVPFRPPKYA